MVTWSPPVRPSDSMTNRTQNQSTSIKFNIYTINRISKKVKKKQKIKRCDMSRCLKAAGRLYERKSLTVPSRQLPLSSFSSWSPQFSAKRRQHVSMCFEWSAANKKNIVLFCDNLLSQLPLLLFLLRLLFTVLTLTLSFVMRLDFSLFSLLKILSKIFQERANQAP